MSNQQLTTDDVYWNHEVEINVMHINDILMTNILTTISTSPLVQSAFVDLIICLNDLMQKARLKDLRVTFTDDVVIENNIVNITDLVAVFRGAVCHIPSDSRKVAKTSHALVFTRGFGITHIATIDTIDLIGEYADDIAVFYGHRRIYYKRHILRAFNECKVKLLPLTGNSPDFLQLSPYRNIRQTYSSSPSPDTHCRKHQLKNRRVRHRDFH